MQPTPIRFGLIGVGGYAQQHLNAILALEKRGLARLEAVSSRNETTARSALAARGCTVPPIFTDYRTLLSQAQVDAIAIPTPMYLHCEMAIAALRRGYPVFMEKPPVVTLDQWHQVMAALRESGKPCQINFQGMSGKHTRDLKRWVVEGKLGKIESVVAYSHQKRYDSYYARAPWAGKIHLDGKLVRDGSVNNPMAHQLNHALFVGCDKPFEWLQPQQVRAELYRGHDIETEDTTSQEIVTREGTKVYYYTTLCSKSHMNKTAWHVTGTKAAAVLDLESLQLFRGYKVEEKIAYQQGDHGTPEAMMENFVLFLQGNADRLLCPFEKMRAFVSAIDGMFGSAQEVHAVPAKNLHRFPIENTMATEIVDIDEHLQEAAKRKVLLSDLKIPWAVPTKPFSLPEANA